MLRTPIVAVVAAAIAAVGCQGGKPPPPAPPPPKVTIAQPIQRKLADYGEYTGYMDAVQRVEIKPRVRGRLDKVHFHEGTEIEQGVLLYEIDPREYQTTLDEAKAALARAAADQKRAAAERERADASLKRMASLRGAGVSQDEYDKSAAEAKTTAAAVGQADAALEQAKAKVAAAELDLSFTKIYSPIAGRISRTMVTEGNLVGFGGEPTLLTVMVDLDPIYVFFELPERDAVQYERRAKAEGRPLWSAGKIPLEVGVETEDGYPHKGVINFRDPRFEPGTGTVRLRGILDNADRKLSSGMFAKVRFPLGDPRDQLLIPFTAVLSDQRGRFVYVVGPDNVVAYRPVTLGTRVGPLVAVGGLKPDDWVIVNGVQKARPKATVDPERKPIEVPAG